MGKAIFDSLDQDGWNLSVPLIQGGMGVGVSLSSLAGAVAKEGGHLGFKPEDIEPMMEGSFDEEVKQIVEEKASYEAAYGKKIPVFLAGGIWDHEDALYAKTLGVDCVQVATRFVATEECDASMAYKMAYVNAKAEDVTIIKSPVGMPGRALNNKMIQDLQYGKQKIQGLIFCGTNVARITKIESVHDVIEDIMYM